MLLLSTTAPSLGMMVRARSTVNCTSLRTSRFRPARFSAFFNWLKDANCCSRVCVLALISQGNNVCELVCDAGAIGLRSQVVKQTRNRSPENEQAHHDDRFPPQVECESIHHRTREVGCTAVGHRVNIVRNGYAASVGEDLRRKGFRTCAEVRSRSPSWRLPEVRRPQPLPDDREWKPLLSSSLSSCGTLNAKRRLHRSQETARQSVPKPGTVSSSHHVSQLAENLILVRPLRNRPRAHLAIALRTHHFLKQQNNVACVHQLFGPDEQFKSVSILACFR